MKIARSLVLILLLNLLIAIPSLHAGNCLFQYSTIQALMGGFTTVI